MARKDTQTFNDFKSLSCLDRMVITGTSQTFGYEDAMRRFCRENRMDERFLADWARPLTDRIKEFTETLALTFGTEIIDCNKYKDRKDVLIKKLMSERKYGNGDIIAIFKSMENCSAFYRSQTAMKAKLDGCPLKLRKNKCIHFYIYLFDKKLGLVSLRIQSYAPFNIQFIVNGHHILEQSMAEKGISFEKKDNCFTRLGDHGEAQKLADVITGPMIDDELTRISRSYVPLQDIMPLWYRFTVRQIEYSRDVYTPTDEQSVDKVRNTIIQLCLQRPDDFISYITDAPRIPRKPEFSYRNTRLGICAKFHSGTTSIKAYHKFDTILRIETSCYNTRKIRMMRVVVDRNGVKKMKNDQLTRSLKDVGLFIKFANHSNGRMADRLQTFWSQSYSNKELRKTSGRTEGQKINFSGINFFAQKDADILTAAASPQHDLSGFKRSDIARAAKLHPGQAGYAIRRLRAHNLVKKVNGTNRYYLTKKGRRATSGALLLETIVMAPLMTAM